MGKSGEIGITPEEMDKIAQELSGIISDLEEAIYYCEKIRSSEFYHQGHAYSAMCDYGGLKQAHDKIHELQMHYMVLCSHVELVNTSMQNLDNSLAKSIESAKEYDKYE